MIVRPPLTRARRSTHFALNSHSSKKNDGKAAVRFYDRDGPAAQSYGIAPYSNVVFADSSYLWYGVEDNRLERRFLRSRWFDFLP